MTQSTNQKRIAILGANGRLSREVARAFHAAGWSVRAITRNGKSDALAVLPGIELVKADAMDRGELIAATKDCGFIFNGLNPVYTQWAEKCMPMAENVLAAAKANRAIHLFPGNVYNFGTSMPQTLTPETPARPDHRKAKIRVEMETRFAEAAKTEGIQTIMLRAGDFFGGDGTGSWFDLGIISKLSKNKFTYPGNRNIVHAWAYSPDLAKVFVGLAEHADKLSTYESFHFEGHNVSGEKMHQAFETAFGAPLKRAAISSLMIKIAGLFSAQMREVGEVFYLWHMPHQMKDDRLEQIIGPIDRTPLAEALKQALLDQKIQLKAGSQKSATLSLA